MKKNILILCCIAVFTFNISCNNDETDTMDPSDNTEMPNNLQGGINEISITQNISGQDVARKVYVRLPQTIDASISYPIVFGFHGAGGNGQNFANNTTLTSLIDAGEFIGVYPNGSSNNGSNGGFWNLGSEPTDADDIAFVGIIMDVLQSYTYMNISKAYAFGFSNGAGMSNLLGKSTSHFRAIAPLFSQQITSIGDLTAPQSISVYQLNGEIDGLIPIEGGTSSVGEFLSAEESASNWATAFNCDSNLSVSNFTWGNVSLTSYTNNNCNNSHEIIRITAYDVGHGFQDATANSLVYEDIWAFFKRH